jgi:salicylate hydroxylase
MKIAIAGLGVAGGVIATGLTGLPGIELLAFEKVGPDDHAFAGNGLNVGPNALRALEAALPEMAARLRAASLPWRQWRAATIGGEPLYEIALPEVAEVEGIRIRWAELYRACRASAQGAGIAHFKAEVGSARLTPHGVSLGVLEAGGSAREIDGFDLVIAADGRYSAVREQLSGAPAVTHLGVGNFRLLLDDGGKLPIDDLEQWFNGPARLLAFRLKEGLIYLSGNIPIEAGLEISEELKSAEGIRRCYLPADGRIAPVPGWLLDGACTGASRGELHWSRVQEASSAWRDASGRALYVGDCGHAMVPTLGQGATCAIEDGAVFVQLFREAYEREGARLDVPALTRRYEAARTPRLDFIRAFSWEASDVLMAPGFSLDKVRAKGGAAYRAKLRQLYDGLDLRETMQA